MHMDVPMQKISLEDYRVNLDCYHGPLDLLLYLVKRHEVDLNNLPIAQLTEQYLQHLKLIQEIDVDLAGEFLVMAATLLEIKSQMLLPPSQTQDAAEATDAISDGDPRFELVQQLLAYKRFKDAAMDLEERRETWEKRFPCQPFTHEHKEGDDGADKVEFDLEDVNVLDLCEAFARILESIGQSAVTHNVVYDDTPIELHAEDIVDRLGRDGAMSLQKIFVGRTNRAELIGLFLATLELVRQKRVRVVQDRIGGEISLELSPEGDRLGAGDDVEHDWRDPETGEIQYDWPSEEARIRAARRAKLRATRAAKGRFGQTDELEDEIIDVDGDSDDEVVEEASAEPFDAETQPSPDQPQS